MSILKRTKLIVSSIIISTTVTSCNCSSVVKKAIHIPKDCIADITESESIETDIAETESEEFIDAELGNSVGQRTKLFKLNLLIELAKAEIELIYLLKKQMKATGLSAFKNFIQDLKSQTDIREIDNHVQETKDDLKLLVQLTAVNYMDFLDTDIERMTKFSTALCWVIKGVPDYTNRTDAATFFTTNNIRRLQIFISTKLALLENLKVQAEFKETLKRDMGTNREYHLQADIEAEDKDASTAEENLVGDMVNGSLDKKKRTGGDDTEENKLGSKTANGNLNEIKEVDDDEEKCHICFDKDALATNSAYICDQCKGPICLECYENIQNSYYNNGCPFCRHPFPDKY